MNQQVQFKIIQANTENVQIIPVMGKNYSSYMFQATVEHSGVQSPVRIEVFSKYAPAKFLPGTSWVGERKQDQNGWFVACSKRDNPALGHNQDGGGNGGGYQRGGGGNGGGYSKPAPYTVDDFDALYGHAVAVVSRQFPDLKPGDDAFSVALGNYVNNAVRVGVKAGMPIAPPAAMSGGNFADDLKADEVPW